MYNLLINIINKYNMYLKVQRSRADICLWAKTDMSGLIRTNIYKKMYLL